MTDHVTTAIIVGYGLLVLSVGLTFARRQTDPETFFLADRTLGTFQVFGSTFSTFLGTGIVFTLASFGYLYGVGAFILPGAAVLGFVLFAWAAPRIKTISDEQGAITLPGLLHAYWSARTRLLAALVTASLFAGTLAATLVAAGNILQVLFGVRFESASLLLAVSQSCIQFSGDSPAYCGPIFSRWGSSSLLSWLYYRHSFSSKQVPE